ncbi:MAG: alpha/beta fold hydrolase, partial [Actinomycetota bacterium]
APPGRPPRDEREALVAQCVAEVLGLARVGVDDNFFDLGGHSLLLVALQGRLWEVLGRRVPVHDLVARPTVAALAEHLGRAGGRDRSALDVLLPLRPTGGRAPLFCVHSLFGLAWPYGRLVRHLDRERPVYGLQARGLARTEALPRSLDEMAADYVAHLRRVQPEGPYHLLGWSLGGVVAHAMAVHLQEAGERVGLLALVDSYPLVAEDPGGARPDDERDVLEFVARLAGVDPGRPGGAAPDRGRVLDEVRAAGGLFGAIDDETLPAVVDVAANATRLARAATPRLFAGDALFFTATGDKGGTSLSAALWEPFVAGRVENHDVEADHLAMVEPDALAAWGPILERRLHDQTGAARSRTMERMS